MPLLVLCGNSGVATVPPFKADREEEWKKQEAVAQISVQSMQLCNFGKIRGIPNHGV